MAESAKIWAVGLSLGLAMALSTPARAQSRQLDPHQTQSHLGYHGVASHCHHHGHDCCHHKHRRRPFQQFCDDYRQANVWPEPYTHVARHSVQQILDAQIVKGWAKMTTLYDHHFDAESNQLNEAGRLHLHYIANYTPLHRRFVFVQATNDPLQTDERVEEVRQNLNEWIAADRLPLIQVTDSMSVGARAEELGIEQEKYLDSVPVPRLPISSGPGVAAGTASTQTTTSGGTTQ